MLDGTESISDGEFLYRRIPVSQNWYNPELQEGRTSPLAFKPTPRDETGLSVYRAKYKSPQEVAATSRGSKYYVAKLSARDLRQSGMIVQACPLPGDPAHSQIIDLTYENRKSDRSKELMLHLAEDLCVEVLGPFP